MFFYSFDIIAPTWEMVTPFNTFLSHVLLTRGYTPSSLVKHQTLVSPETSFWRSDRFWVPFEWSCWIFFSTFGEAPECMSMFYAGLLLTFLFMKNSQLATTYSGHHFFPWPREAAMKTACVCSDGYANVLILFYKVVVSTYFAHISCCNPTFSFWISQIKLCCS